MVFWKQRAEMVMKEGVLGAPPKKVLGSKYKLPAGCDGSTDPGAEFWGKFPRKRDQKGTVLVTAMKLMSLALAVGGVDMRMVELVCQDLEQGSGYWLPGGGKGAHGERECGQLPAVSGADN